MNTYITRAELVDALRLARDEIIDRTVIGAALARFAIAMEVDLLTPKPTPATSPEPEMPTREDWEYVALAITEHFGGPIGRTLQGFSRRMASGELVAVPVGLIAQHDGKACVWYAESNRITAERDRLRGELSEAKALLLSWNNARENSMPSIPTRAFLSRTESPKGSGAERP